MNQLPCDDQTAALLASVRGGDESAFAVLLDSYAPLLNSLSSSLGASSEAQDELMQEARFALYRAALSYREGGVTFGLYAKICVRNALVSRLRKAEREVALCSLDHLSDSLMPQDGGDALDSLLRDESFRELCSRIAELLSPYERRVFVLYASGLSLKEVAHELGKAQKSVRNALDRCLSKLRHTEWRAPR